MKQKQSNMAQVKQSVYPSIFKEEYIGYFKEAKISVFICYSNKELSSIERVAYYLDFPYHSGLEFVKLLGFTQKETSDQNCYYISCGKVCIKINDADAKQILNNNNYGSIVTEILD